MAKEIVDVYNAGLVEYVETWNDVTYKIPARGSIKMKRRDAVNFLGTCSGDCIKNLEIRRDGEQVNTIALGTSENPKAFVCMKDGKEFASQALLDEHLKQYSAEVVVDPDKEEPEEVAEYPTADETGGNIQCPLCSKKVKNVVGLKRHLKTH